MSIVYFSSATIVKELVTKQKKLPLICRVLHRPFADIKTNYHIIASCEILGCISFLFMLLHVHITCLYAHTILHQVELCMFLIVSRLLAHQLIILDDTATSHAMAVFPATHS